MIKTVALQHPATLLAETLAAKGYRVISLHEAVSHRIYTDAILYSARRAETVPAFHSGLETVDISVGHRGEETLGDTLPGAIMLNIAGLHPEQVAAELEARLRHRPWRT
ncbi:hypothetical protein [Anaeroselena agilis]|uniref:Uncharacterized protein n=1 Tax=Anaeroselena agilis TaxID=3063788 RepID=A0ABU3P4E4_9FIRM|nr:hypothetical protein [Selenomonadales bacterium 4137-cl]